MELSDYSLTFIHIKGSNNILAATIFRLKTLDINKNSLENPKTTTINDTEECIAEVMANEIQTLSNDRLHAEQKKDMNCRKVAAQSYHKNRNSFNLVIISADSLLLKQQYIYVLRHDGIIAPHSVVPIILHEFHNSKGHQGTICTFETIGKFYWWPTLCKIS